MNADTEGGAALPSDELIDLAVEVFRMLAHSIRVKLLLALLPGERSVNDLAGAVGRPQAVVSQHLAKLRMARLVQTSRQGNHVFYRIESDHVRQLLTDALHNAEHASGGVPVHHRGGSQVLQLPAPDRRTP